MILCLNLDHNPKRLVPRAAIRSLAEAFSSRVFSLPPLLMASAYFTVWRDFRAELRPIVLLAIGAVTFTTLLVGWVTKQWAPALPWGACFALGAIVSPPDG